MDMLWVKILGIIDCLSIFVSVAVLQLDFVRFQVPGYVSCLFRELQ